MNNLTSSFLSFLTQSAFSDEQLAAPSFAETMLRTMPMFAMVFGIFYFLVIRPQAAKDRAHRALLSTLKRGDLVVTGSGLIARVVSVDGQTVTLDSGSGARLKFEIQHIEKRFEGKVSFESQIGNG